MAIVGRHNADHLKAFFSLSLLLDHLLPGAIAAVWSDAECGGKVPATVGIRSKNACDQRIAVVKPGGVAMSFTNIRSRPTADNTEPYFSLWLIRFFLHNIIL